MTLLTEATMSVFDSGLAFGDGVWDGRRIVDRYPAWLEALINCLYKFAITR